MNKFVLKASPGLFLLLGWFYYEKDSPGYFACLVLFGVFLVGAILLEEIRGK